MNSDAIYNTIIQVQMTSSTNSKMDILRQMDGNMVEKVLRYALDPHKMYYIKTIPCPARVGTNEFSDLTFKLLDVLSNRSLSGGAAKVTIDKYLLSLTKKSQYLFKFIIEKSFHAGFGAETVNKVFYGLIPVFKVMKCEDWDPKRFRRGSFVGTKLDGIRATYREGSYWTRSGHRIVGLDHLTNKARDWELKGEWDGELDIPGVEFNKASGIIRSSAHSKPSVRFTCFDLPLWDGSFRERQDYYYKTLSIQNDHMFRPLGHHPVNSVAAVLEHFKYALDMGQEGVVVKFGNSPYSRKRSWDWMKLKCGEFMDCQVIDYHQGQGKFEGMIGKLIVYNADTNRSYTIGVGKMTQHDQKKYFGSGFREIENKKVEVAYMEKQPSGDLRHGRFSKFLWDR